jgi:hypothetical protein
MRSTWIYKENKMLLSKPIKLSIFAFLLLAVGVWVQDKTSQAYSRVAVGTGGSVGGKSN